MGRKSTHPRLDSDGNPYCSQCQHYLPPRAFTLRTTTTHGYDYVCKACHATERRIYNAANPEKHRAANNKQSAKNKALDENERIVPKAKRCLICGELQKIDAFHTLKRNSDGHFAYCKTCYARQRNCTPNGPQHYWLAGLEGIEEAALCTLCQRLVPVCECTVDPRGYKRLTIRCIPCRSQQRIAWRQEHPMQDRLAVHRSRIKNRPHRHGSVVEVVTDADIDAIWAKFGYACAYCENADVPLTIDHMIPISNGGVHSKDNIVPACLSCNSRKRTLSVDEFLTRNPRRKDPRLKQR